MEGQARDQGPALKVRWNLSNDIAGVALLGIVKGRPLSLLIFLRPEVILYDFSR